MILFVDINDVCRAPLAARLYQQIHGVPAHSAGTYAQRGASLGDAVRPTLLDGHRARLLSDAMLEKSTCIWCVTAAIAQHLLQEYPQFAHKIHAMADISDPFGMGKDAYEQCVNDVRTQVEGLT